MLDLLCLCFVCLKKELSGNIGTVVRPKSPISVKHIQEPYLADTQST